MKTIYKYPLEITSEQEVEVLQGHNLCVQMQGNTPCLWVMGSPDLPKVKLLIQIAGTGQSHSHIDSSHYIGTVQQAGFVWHIFGHRV